MAYQKIRLFSLIGQNTLSFAPVGSDQRLKIFKVKSGNHINNNFIINKVTLSDILNENPSLSIRDAREQLMEENEHRDDLLQKCILARNSLLSGKPIPQSLVTENHKEPPKKSPKKSKMAKRVSAGSDKNSRVPSPNRSIRKGKALEFIYTPHPDQVYFRLFSTIRQYICIYILDILNKYKVHVLRSLHSINSHNTISTFFDILFSQLALSSLSSPIVNSPNIQKNAMALKSNSVPASLYGSTPLTRKESIKVRVKIFLKILRSFKMIVNFIMLEF